MKKIIRTWLLAVGLMFVGNSIAFADTFSADVTYKKDNQSVTKTVTNAQAGVNEITIGYYDPEDTNSEYGIFNCINVEGQDIVCQKDVITGNLKDTFGKDITIALPDTEGALIAIKTKDEDSEFTFNVTIEVGSSNTVGEVIISGRNADVFNLKGEGTYGSLFIEKSIVNLIDSTIKPKERIITTSSPTIAMGLGAKLNILSGSLDFSGLDEGAGTIHVSNEGTITIGDSTKTLVYDNPVVDLGSQTTLANVDVNFVNGGIIYSSNDGLPDEIKIAEGKELTKKASGEKYLYYISGSTATPDPDAPSEEDLKIWEEFIEAYIKNLKESLKDYDITYTSDESHLTVTYSTKPTTVGDDDPIITNTLEFTYKDGVLTYTNNVTKDDLDAITDEDEMDLMWSKSFLDSFVVANAIVTLSEIKDYDNDVVEEWLEDKIDNLTLKDNGVEASILNYAFKDGGKVVIIKSLKLDIKNGLKGYEDYIDKDDDKDEDDKKEDKKDDGEIDPAYTGVAIPTIAIGALSSGFVYLKKKKNILNRL